MTFILADIFTEWHLAELPTEWLLSKLNTVLDNFYLSKLSTE